ncbi:DMT family transporter [Lutibaculum baratangense]|uniref:Permease of the drug/metabolite transporter (DMT) superfamily n=1 Tax=Lutibaculum baratangense AMV1 TaxID=631454 RepID=V4R2B8_9HYPH|nr:DMT family transporter [Lutibaculum baratangense]ESR26097.1 Permease of the drug/metabolite transporter (DMT) superfamily [Lutibaculum baratangense AMV1]
MGKPGSTTLLLTAVAMAAFAGNSLLARAALSDGAMDPASYTLVRLVAGAIVLGLLLLPRQRPRGLAALPGSWASAAALFAYALAFSLAYLRLGAAIGTLILFASVQATMIGWGIARGHRPTPLEFAGLVLALGGLVYLLMPGLQTPDLVGSLLMVSSGAAWGVYSLRGRSARNPLDETAGNFLRAAMLCPPLFLVFLGDAGALSLAGCILAVVSGAVTSGLGYAVWYRTLPGLSPAQAGIVQLTVPVIAAFGAVLFLSEVLTLRILVGGALILGGVGLAILSRTPAAPRPIPNPRHTSD